MKRIFSKVKDHSKKVVIHLKRHHRKYLVGALCSGVLALIGLHTVSTINNTFAQEVGECGTDIVLQVTAEEANQILKINKYFNNDYMVDRGDGSPITLLSGDTSHTYNVASGYTITLSLTGGASRWTFTTGDNPLVPKSGTTVTGVKIICMPSLATGFGLSSTGVGAHFFYNFNKNGALTSLPEGSFDTSNITEVGDNFFAYFNQSGLLTSLPNGSFKTDKITTGGSSFFQAFNQDGSLTGLPQYSFKLSTGLKTVGLSFFSNFNSNGALISLPDGSFDTSSITSVGNNFFSYFNNNGKLTSLPDGSFNISNITTASDYFFRAFNTNGSLTDLPDGSFNISNIKTVGGGFFRAFNQNGKLESLPVGSFNTSRITSVGNYFFSAFNYNGALKSLPDGSFDTSSITSVGNNFFNNFNYSGSLTSLPDGSFNTSNITTGGDNFFQYFNWNGRITDLPDSFTMNSVGSKVSSGYLNAFNSTDYTLNKKVSDLVSGIVAPSDDRNTFSDNQSGRCVYANRLLEDTKDVCTITYNSNGGSVIENPTKTYDTDTSGVVAGSGIDLTRTGYDFTGWYTAQTGGNLVTHLSFPAMGGITLYAHWIKGDVPTCVIEYSTTGWTNQPVTATLTGCSDEVTVTNNSGSTSYTFQNTGTFTFEFKNLVNNKTGSTPATVTWIDKEEPTCQVSYDTQLESGNESATARLTGCNEEVTVTNTSGNVKYYVIGYSGSFTFEFKDRASNTGIAVASINLDRYTIQVNNGDEMLSLYNQNKSLSCKYNYASGLFSQKIMLFVKNGKLYEYFQYSGYDSDYGPYLYYTNILYKNDKLFGWGSFFGSGAGIYTDYENFDLEEEFNDLFDSLGSGEVFMCSTGVDSTSIFNLPDGIIFYDEDHFHNSYYEGIEFSIVIDDTINAGEYTDFTVKVVKDGSTFRDYTGTVIFFILDENGDYLDSKYYDIANKGFYDFSGNDRGRKTFEDGLKIEKPGTYVFQVEGINGGFGQEIITIKGYGQNGFYDDLTYNPNYSDEMNEAYQYARYYDITTKNTIKDANMNGSLTRIAMAKMLSNYAINVLGIDDFNTNKNCTFNDISSALDKKYDYGVTKACQLEIMGINMRYNKFYPYSLVTRAEFATALSRLLYRIEDGVGNYYYSPHINKLRREGIISNTNPKLLEKRGYVMLMLMRAGEEYDN